MKTKHESFFIQIEKEQLANLLTSVNETLATDAAHLEAAKSRKPFTASQLWQMRRQARYSGLSVR